MFFDGGGVTFTGGECTLQSAELLPLLKRLMESGISTCIETNGSLPCLKELAEYISYLIIDLKHPADAEHKRWTGQSNAQTLENTGYFLNSGRQLHIRIPLINGVNICPEKFADYFSQFDTANAVFEFLPYHEFGKDKWQGNYQMKDAFVSTETVAEFTRVFEKHGLKTVRT